MNPKRRLAEDMEDILRDSLPNIVKRMISCQRLAERIASAIERYVSTTVTNHVHPAEKKPAIMRLDYD